MPQKKHRVISFDIDGTLEFGDPPGGITVAQVKKEQQDGSYIGSSSDRPLSNQRDLWKQWGIEPDFIVLKHNIAEIKDKFEAEEYFYIGDSEVDRFYAERARFKFFWANAFAPNIEENLFEGNVEIE